MQATDAPVLLAVPAVASTLAVVGVAVSSHLLILLVSFLLRQKMCKFWTRLELADLVTTHWPLKSTVPAFNINIRQLFCWLG